MLYFKQSESVEVVSMNRAELKRFIFENYNVESDFPWLKYPNYEVFRHSNTQKWFALDGSVSDDKIKMLLDASYDATTSKARPKKH